MGRRSRSPGAFTRFTNQADPKRGWRRFRLTDPDVEEDGISASIVYSALTEDELKTRWVTDDYGTNNYTTSGRGAANGRVWCKRLLNSMGEGVLLTDSFILRVVIEHIAISGDDWGASAEPEPWMAVGISGQAAAADVAGNNHLALSLDYYAKETSDDQWKKTRMGYNAGTTSDSITYHHSNAALPPADAWPVYYYADIRIGPDTDDTTTKNTSISMRGYDSNGDHFGPSQWKLFEPSDTAAIEDTGQAFIFVALTPEGGTGVALTGGNAVTTDFRIWYMVENASSWIPSGNP